MLLQLLVAKALSGLIRLKSRVRPDEVDKAVYGLIRECRFFLMVVRGVQI